MIDIVLFSIFLLVAFAVLWVPAQPSLPSSPAGSDGSPNALRQRLAGVPKAYWVGAGILGLATLAVAVVDLSPPDSELPLLAVLPFESIGDQPPYIALGITDELTTRVGSLDGLRVASASFARRIAATGAVDASGAADFLLEGSVSVDGQGQLRVRARLIETDSGTQLWADVFEQGADRVFAVQGRIAEQVADAMNLTLLPQHREALSKPRTESFAAYQRYLQGITFRRGLFQLEYAKAALASFRGATAIDPDFAAAWAGQASMYGWLAQTHGFSHQEDSARTALARAVELDPDDPDVRLAETLILWTFDLDVEGALRSYREIERIIDPSRLAVVRAYIAGAYWYLGRYDEGVAAQRAALADDPFLPYVSSGLAEYLLLARSYDEVGPLLHRGAASGMRDPRVGASLALLPLLVSGDTATAWAVLTESESLAAESLRDGLSAGSRTMLRIFGRRLDRAEWLAASPAESRAIRTSAQLASGVRAQSRGESGDFHEIATNLEALARERSLTPRFDVRVRSGLAVALASQGLHSRADSVLVNLSELYPDAQDPYMELDFLSASAEVKAMAGDHEGAVSVLEELLERPALISRAMIAVDPLWQPLIRDSRFAERLLPPEHVASGVEQ